MLKERVNYGLSVKECLKLEESLKLNKRFEMNKNFELGKLGEVNLKTIVKYGHIILEVKNSKISKSSMFRKYKSDNINDIFGVYSLNFKYNNEDVSISINLVNEYDSTSSSIGEYIISHLDCLKYKKDVGELDDLYKYLEHYDFDNSVSTLYSSYILQLLDDTKLFNKAGVLFDDKVDDGRLYMLLSEFEDEDIVKEHLNTLINEDSIYIGVLNGILIGLSHVKLHSNHTNPILKLINDNVNSNLLYEKIAKTVSIVDDLEYVNF